MNAIARDAESVWTHVDLPGADVRLTQFCDSTEAKNYFQRLRDEISWQQYRVRLFGREIDSPRLSSWVGDAEAVYTWSRVRHEPAAWTSTLKRLRDQLHERTGEIYNSVLCNLYRDGNDSMGWHSDNEAELGNDPTIASLSFGASRRFRLRAKNDAAHRLDIDLADGSLLLMAGATQRNYRHDLPKAPRIRDARINLTFRRILDRRTGP